MSIGKRLIDLARSELNSLLDKAAEVDEPDDRSDDRSGDRWGGEKRTSDDSGDEDAQRLKPT